MLRLLLVCTLGMAVSAGTELVQNSGFELPTDSGWTVTIGGPGQGRVSRSRRYVRDPDYELLAYRYDGGITKLEQNVPITGTDLYFSCRASLRARELDTAPGAWAAAAIVLSYRDSTGAVLGETRIANLSQRCPWRSNPALHIIPAPARWDSWVLAINDELDSLPEVSRAQIRSISVGVVASGEATARQHSEAWAYADDISLFDTLGRDLACEWVLIDDSRNGVLDPGEAADIVLGLRNTGPNLVAIVGEMRTGHLRCQVLDSLGAWGTLAPAGTAANYGNRFRVRADYYFPWPGDTAAFDILLFGSLVVVETLRIRVPIGDSVSFPTGPNRHDEYAYDDGDFASEAPSFNWIEVNGLGTRLVLGDDETVVVTLPPGFGFRRYGTFFDRLAICSNGWVAPGAPTNSAYANTPLPNAAMPPGLIAVNWDDLYPATGNGVWWHYDSLFDWFVIEWDSVGYYANPYPPDKFEIVIYGRSWCRPTEDNTILLQYLTGAGFYSSTVGIQDLGCASAIQYCFNDNYPATAAPVVPGRAVAFRQPSQASQTEPTASSGKQPELICTPAPFRGRLAITPVGFGLGRLRISVIDRSGRLICSLASNQQTADGLTVFWDGCDQHGQQVGPGVYFVAATDGRWVARAKVVRLD